MNYRIIGKYIKDLEFKIPNPKTFFLLSKDIENYKINIDIKTRIIEKILLLFSSSPKKIYPRRTLIIGIIK